MIAVIKGVIVGEHSDGGVVYVRIKGVGFEGYDQTALVPKAWISELVVQKEDTDDQGNQPGSDI